LAVERVNDAGALMGDTADVDLASETKMSIVSPQHANLKQTDDASTLAKDLLGVGLIPETTVQSVPDATSSPSVDQEVPSVSHPVPFRFSFDPPSDPASVDAFIKAYPNLPGYHTWSSWDRLTAVSTYGTLGSEGDDGLDSGWNFSGLHAPSAVRDFMTACDYCLSDCSDGSHSLGDEDCVPCRECFHVDLGGLGEGNHLGMPENNDPPRPAPCVDILRELAVVPVLAGGQDAQLEQIREMQARLDGEAGQLAQLRQNIGQEGQAGHRPEKRVIWPRTYSTTSMTLLGQDSPRLPVGSARTWLQQQYYSERCQNHPPPRGDVSRESSRTSWRMPWSDGPKALPPEGRDTPRTSRRDFPFHTGSLGPHRAHAGHSACGPGSPRQRAPPPRPSSPPRREGAPRLPPQAWGTL
jgi:hypothetical protein